MIGFAVIFGLLAAFLAQGWLSRQADEQRRSMLAGNKPQQTKTATIVVAKEQMRFASEVSAQQLAEVPWPADAIPAGAFTSVTAILKDGKRLVLTPIEVNEPVLAVKLTGPGERATLSALVGEGKKAVTLRVNDIEGVGGFVLPGDRVDVILTRQLEKGNATADVVLQNVRVLAIDQMADTRMTKASVARSVTVEVDIVDAQKIALAAHVGTLSLLLRKAGEIAEEGTRRVTMDDILKNFVGVSGERKTATVTVTRALKRDEYSVPVERSDAHALAGVGSRPAQVRR
jgi:pilus assembly protein CpaB